MASSNISDRLRSLLVVFSTAATIAYNGLASTGYINGVTTAEVSNRYPTVITPAGFAFSIWAVIYLGLIGFSVFQLLPSKMAAFRPVRTLYIASCFLNCAWLWSWHRDQIGISVAFIVALLGVLFLINLRFTQPEKFVDGLFGKGVFGIYFGWVTAAALINFVIFLTAAGVELTPAMWSILGAALLVLAAGLGILVRFKLRNFLFPLAISWATTGIAVKQSGNTLIVAVAAFCVMSGLIMAISFVMDKKSTTT